MRVLKVYNSTRIFHSEEIITVAPPPPDAIAMFSMPISKGKRKPLKQPQPRKLTRDRFTAEYTVKEVSPEFIIKTLKESCSYH